MSGAAPLQIEPFRGVLYASSSLDSRLAPPYDVISPAEREALASLDPHNVVRLILPSGDGDGRYADAARLYREWLGAGVMARDREPAVYRYQQVFRSEGEEIARTGFVGAVRLRPFADGVVVPHERTMSAPKQDRLNLTRACHAWFSQIFGIYSDPRGEAEAAIATGRPPELEGRTRDGTLHRIWRIRDAAAIQRLQSAMQARRVYIADGHHRYETMLALRDELRTDEARFGPMFLCRMEDPGLVVLATHRLVRSVPAFDIEKLLNGAREFFEVEEAPAQDASALRRDLAERGATRPTLAVASAGQVRFLSLRHEVDACAATRAPAVLARLDVTLLHALLLERILGIDRAAQERQSHLTYVKDFAEALQQSRAPGVQAVFLLNPTRVEELKAVADAGEIMPQKSTYFFPKLASGLVTYPLDPP